MDDEEKPEDPQPMVRTRSYKARITDLGDGRAEITIQAATRDLVKGVVGGLHEILRVAAEESDKKTSGADGVVGVTEGVVAVLRGPDGKLKN